MMTEKQAGFSMIELLIAMTLFLVVIIAATGVFAPLLMSSKQQASRIETNIEGIVGLDILRRDIQQAGIGLPWDLNGASYLEADNTQNVTLQDEEWYNDSPNSVPRALVSGNGDGDGGAVSGDGSGSDVLVIKSVIVAGNDVSQKWAHVNDKNIVNEWIPDTNKLETDDRVIVLIPGKTRTLRVTSGGSFTTRYVDNDPGDDALADSAFQSPDPERDYIVYGVAPSAIPTSTALRMPFNRADYYVRTPASGMPSRCAPGTGILYKGVINQSTGTAAAGGGLNELPIIDCVADMQVVYGVDNDDDGDFENPAVYFGSTDYYTDDFSLNLTSAEDVRNIRQVRVYILAQEGQRDPGFTFNNFTCAGNCIKVEDSTVAGLGRDFDLTAITDWANYRWKVYSLVVKIEG